MTATAATAVQIHIRVVGFRMFRSVPCRPCRPCCPSAADTGQRIRRPKAGGRGPERVPGHRSASPVPYRNELISIVSSRPGPTPIAEIGAPDISSSALTYAWAFFGSSEKDFALLMSSLQPGSIS